MAAGSDWLRINGSPATEIAAHTPVTWSTEADGGCTSASFALALSRRSQHRDLRPGVLVQAMRGPVPVWTGLMMEPDRSTWECHAVGLSASLREMLALNAAGGSTRDVGAAVTQAIARGWKGSNPEKVAGLAAGDADGNPITVGALLDDFADQTGQRWGVDGRGRLYLRPDPVAPRWLAAPDSAIFVPTSENTPRRLAGRFDAGGGSFLTAFAGHGFPEEAVDLTDRGPMTLLGAQAILNGMLIRNGQHGWANSVTLHRRQITTTGGTPAHLATVRGGQMIQAHGVAYVDSSRTPWVSVVLGKTTYTADSDQITVEPVNTAPRTALDVWAS